MLRAISGKEAKVKETLDALCQNTDLGNDVFQVLIPTEKVLTVRNGKKVVKERNLYSGYVFVDCNLNGRVIQDLSNTTNVIDFAFGKTGQEYLHWNLTELVKKWYIEGTDNTTIAVAMMNEDEIDTYYYYASATALAHAETHACRNVDASAYKHAGAHAGRAGRKVQ